MVQRVSTGLLVAQSDQRLVELVRAGHERAFEVLLRRHRRLLLRYCRRMGLGEGLVEDVLQQAFLQAWLALERGVEVREPRPWLYRIVHNTAINAARRSSGRDGALDEAASIAAVASTESAIEGAILVRDALTDVAALPQMQREAILLSAVDGRSHEEVASALGVSPDAVRGLLYRARAALRASAAAITPQPLISWACGHVGRSAPTTERLAEMSAPAGAAGMAGVLLKGAAVAVTAAVVVAGAAVAPFHRHRVQRRAAAVQHAGPAGATALVDSRAASANAALGLARFRGNRPRAGTQRLGSPAPAASSERSSRAGLAPRALLPAARTAPPPAGADTLSAATQPVQRGTGGQGSTPVAVPASAGDAPQSGPSSQSDGPAEAVQGAAGEGGGGSGAGGGQSPGGAGGATGGGSGGGGSGGGGSGPGSESGGSGHESSDDGSSSGDGQDSGESETDEAGGSGDEAESHGDQKEGAGSAGGEGGGKKTEATREGGPGVKDS